MFLSMACGGKKLLGVGAGSKARRAPGCRMRPEGPKEFWLCCRNRFSYRMQMRGGGRCRLHGMVGDGQAGASGHNFVCSVGK